MPRIRIQNFGPVKEGVTDSQGWIDIKKVTVFIGNQGSGKSTVAKLISTFMWIEKALWRGDYPVKFFERKNKLKNQFLTYHRLENYLKNNGGGASLIEYEGDAFWIKFEGGFLNVEERPASNYPLPQIMYVPAERNFISYVKTPKELKFSSESLKEFVSEFDNAKNEMKGSVKLPVNNVDVEYDKLNDTINLKGDGYKVRINEASSGFQSLVPVYLVSQYLANSVKKQSESRDQMTSDELSRFRKGAEAIISNDSLTDEQKRIAISVLSSRFNKSSFINIVEEPEQNLFPFSQWNLLASLLEFNNMNSGNTLIMTTHSPYIVNYLTIAVQAHTLQEKIAKLKNNAALEKLGSVIPLKAIVSGEDVMVYELSEKTGTIKKLPDYHGVPTDKNYLNQALKEGNELFDKLLEIEEDLK